MGTARSPIRPSRAAPLLLLLLPATIASWVAGWTWLALVATLAVLCVAACAVGADTRAPGDWRRDAEPPR